MAGVCTQLSAPNATCSHDVQGTEVVPEQLDAP